MRISAPLSRSVFPYFTELQNFRKDDMVFTVS